MTAAFFFATASAFACINLAFGLSFTSLQSGAWSSIATWHGGSISDNHLPGRWDDVVIVSGNRVVLDISTHVRSIHVQRNATLTCPKNMKIPIPAFKLTLTVSTLRVEGRGCFSCGYGDCSESSEPFTGTFILRLHSEVAPLRAESNERSLIVESGGAIFLVGARRVSPIARLAENVEAGGDTIKLACATLPHDDNAQPWQVGDRVALAPTDWYPTQTEYGVISKISADPTSDVVVVVLADVLQHARNGRTNTILNKADGDRVVGIDTRGEVALLSRNIIIEGVNDAQNGLGGDVMVVGQNSRVHLAWVEFRYLGRRGHVGRYPLHIHNLGVSGNTVLVQHVAIHSSFQRGIVIHCTHGATIANNTVAGTYGFGFMLEDGSEEDNIFVGNYAIDIKPSQSSLIQTERINPAGFWFLNVANTWKDNVAAGVSGSGFSLDMDVVLLKRPGSLNTCPESLPGYDGRYYAHDRDSFSRDVYHAIIRRRAGKFENNVAHSSHSGIWLSRPYTIFDAPRFLVSNFTAWKISPRDMFPPELTDGVLMTFEACFRAIEMRQVVVQQMTCLNSPRVAWANSPTVFEGTTIAWLGGDRLKSSGVVGRWPISMRGSIVAYTQPHTYLRTHWEPGEDASPLVVTLAFRGGPLAHINQLSGVSVGNAGTSHLIALNSGDLHAFTDLSGDVFGAGPGAVVAASCVGCSNVDPVVETYAPGICASAAHIDARSSQESRRLGHVAMLPNGRSVHVLNGVPILCRGGDTRLGWIDLQLYQSDRIKIANTSASIHRGVGPKTHFLRTASSFPLIIPLNAASMHTDTGGYTLAIEADWPNVSEVVLELGPTTLSSDGLTIRLTGLPLTEPATADEERHIINETGTYDSCPSISGQACEKSDPCRSSHPVCICLDRNSGSVVVRFTALSRPKYVGHYGAFENEIVTYEPRKFLLRSIARAPPRLRASGAAGD